MEKESNRLRFVHTTRYRIVDTVSSQLTRFYEFHSQIINFFPLYGLFHHQFILDRSKWREEGKEEERKFHNVK